MNSVFVCEECGAPEIICQAHSWLNNGDIVQNANQHARVGFIECEMLDPLFRNVGDIIGMPIEKHVVTITAKGIKAYFNQIVPQDVKKILRGKNPDLQLDFIESTMMLCQTLGYGKYEFMGMRYEKDEDDYSKMRILKPFSLAEAAGTYCGAISVFAGGEHTVTYEEVAPELHEFTSRWVKHPEALKETRMLRDYNHKDGDIELERCQSCGSPKAFTHFRWYLDDGLIVNKSTRRRMAIMGPELLDRLFESLKAIFGETALRAVVEAQRRIIMSGFSTGMALGQEELRDQLALRGMGKLQKIKMNPQGLFIRINNVSGYYMIVGILQGLYERTFNKESEVCWELSKEGDLQVEITSRSEQFSLTSPR